MKSVRRCSVFMLATTLVGWSSGCSKAPHPPQQTVQDAPGSPAALTHQLLMSRFPADQPGAAVLVARHGHVLFERGYGLADLTKRTPITPTMKFRIGSLTKEFTAASILRLQEERKLNVTDKLARYFPDFPRANEVTLHHMLSHTSGIANVLSTRFFAEHYAARVAPETVVSVFASEPFTFDPGTPGKAWGYSNSPYFLLGEIVSKVSARSYGDYLLRTFFTPLGMTNSGVYQDEQPPNDFVTGHEYYDGGFRPAAIWHASWLGGAGELYSDLRDLHRWYEGMFAGSLLSESSRKAMWTSYSTARGLPGFSDFDYGYGWVIARVRGARELSHAGATPGFICNAIRLPQYELTVIVLENAYPPRPGTDPIALSREIAGLFLGDELAPASETNPAAAGDGPALEVTPPPLGM